MSGLLFDSATQLTNSISAYAVSLGCSLLIGKSLIKVNHYANTGENNTTTTALKVCLGLFLLPHKMYSINR